MKVLPNWDAYQEYINEIQYDPNWKDTFQILQRMYLNWLFYPANSMEGMLCCPANNMPTYGVLRIYQYSLIRTEPIFVQWNEDVEMTVRRLFAGIPEFRFIVTAGSARISTLPLVIGDPYFTLFHDAENDAALDWSPWEIFWNWSEAHQDILEPADYSHVFITRDETAHFVVYLFRNVLNENGSIIADALHLENGEITFRKDAEIPAGILNDAEKGEDG